MTLRHFVFLLLFSQTLALFCHGFGFTYHPKRQSRSQKHAPTPSLSLLHNACSFKRNGASYRSCSGWILVDEASSKLAFSRGSDDSLNLLLKASTRSVATSSRLYAQSESSKSEDIKNDNDTSFVVRKSISRFVTHLTTRLQSFRAKIRKIYQGLQSWVTSSTTTKSDTEEQSVDSRNDLDYEPANVATAATVVESKTDEKSEATSLETPSVVAREREYPIGSRWAISANTTDLTGHWKPIVTTEFKQQYDEYLQNCSQSFIFRKLVMQAIGLTTEQIFHENEGREVSIWGVSPAGTWKRTLVSSGSDYEYDTCCEDDSNNNNEDCWQPIHVEIKDPDGDLVKVESWWEDNGRLHKSWLRGKPRVLGGTFETTRYLDEENPDILYCDSKFHPAPNTGGKFRFGNVIWKFQRCKEE